jgi:hypothetical protein
LVAFRKEVTLYVGNSGGLNVLDLGQRTTRRRVLATVLGLMYIRGGIGLGKQDGDFY